MEIDVTDYKSCLESNNIGMNALTYIAGYLLKKRFLKHSCDICQEELIQQKLVSSTQLLCQFKAYEESEKKPFGGLIPPSDVFVNYVLELKAIFMMEFERNVSKTDIGKYLLSKLPTFSSLKCLCFLSWYLLKLLFRMQIYYALKFGSRELYSLKKKDRKYHKVCHL